MKVIIIYIVINIEIEVLYRATLVGWSNNINSHSSNKYILFTCCMCSI